MCDAFIATAIAFYLRKRPGKAFTGRLRRSDMSCRICWALEYCQKCFFSRGRSHPYDIAIRRDEVNLQTSFELCVRRSHANLRQAAYGLVAALEFFFCRCLSVLSLSFQLCHLPSHHFNNTALTRHQNLTAITFAFELRHLRDNHTPFKTTDSHSHY